MKPTIITTNFNFEEIGNIFGYRVESRLGSSENCLVQKWNTEKINYDLRKQGL